MEIATPGEIRVRLTADAHRILLDTRLPDGAKVSGVKLRRANPEEPRVSFVVGPEPDGTVRLPAVPPGRYALEVWIEREGKLSVRRREDLEPGGVPVFLDFTKPE